MARDVQSTVGSPTPRISHVAPPFTVRMTAATVATMIVRGVVLESITTEFVTRSGRFWFGSPPSVPLISFQLPPVSGVRNTCLVRTVGAMPVGREKTTATVFLSVGSIAIEPTALPPGAFVTLIALQFAAAPVFRFAVVCTVPLSRPTHIVLESCGVMARHRMLAGKVWTRAKVTPPSVL